MPGRRCRRQLIGTVALEGTELATFFVLPDIRARGIGTRLLTAIEQRARSLGITRLTVDSSVTGAAFYARMGYLRTGVEREGTAGMQSAWRNCCELTDLDNRLAYAILTAYSYPGRTDDPRCAAPRHKEAPMNRHRPDRL